MSSHWNCVRCTFENASSAGSCIICMHKRPTVRSNSTSNGNSNSNGNATTMPTNKKAKSSSSIAKSGGGMASFLLTSVGSSKEQEAKRLAKKIEQMRELGIELPAERIVELLARNCYCVHVAASEYFERMATAEQDAATSSSSSASGEPGAPGATMIRDPIVAASVALFENASSSFLGPPYRLLGSTTVKASITRKHTRLALGDRLLFQGENVGNKRARPGSSSTVSTSGTSSSPGATTTSPPSTVVTSTANGIVRISTMDHVQLGRLERELEIVFHPLLKEGLVALGGVCVDPPFSATVFAAFRVKLFVFVHPRAFDIFQDHHALFHLSDALYFVLQTIHSGGARGGDTPSPLTQALAATATVEGSNGDNTTDGTAVIPPDLETLFSAFVGPVASESTGQQSDTDAPAQQLTPLFKDGFSLRSHQTQALAWMLWRETQQPATSSSTTSGGEADDVNPLWETRRLHSQEIYYINPFEKIASLTRPKPPTPCRGGILADDMGMGKTIMLLSLVAHRKFFRASDLTTTTTTGRSSSSSRNRTGHTLIVCPLSLLHQWKQEVDDRFQPKTLSVCVYYGDERGSALSLTTSDVVLTTYGVLSSEFEKNNTSTSTMAPSALLSTQWHRVILDEAHSIKNRATTYFRACAALRATHRWCLTGTPLQNALSDLFSLLCFLQYEPWSRVAWWQRVIAKPFDQGDDDALTRLKVLLQPILLRRTKRSRDAQGNSIVELPAKHVEIVRLQFSDEERAFYKAVYDRSRAEFNGFVASGTTMNSYIAIFALLLRLRQACDHPFLALGRNSELAAATKSGKQDQDVDGAGFSKALRLERAAGETMESYFHRITARLEQDASATSAATITATTTATVSAQYIQNVLTQIREEGVDAQECPVCLDPPTCGVLTPCAHLLCEKCLRDSVASDPESGCPVCRAPVDMDKVFAISTADAVAVADPPATSTHEKENDQTASLFLSAKLRQLIHDLQVIRSEDEQLLAASSSPSSEQAPFPRRKIVVFSQWTHMLEMVTQLLAQCHFRSCMFHGSMSQESREKVLRTFHSDPQMDVLVISLKAGGVGLNLTCASVVVLLDPWWNPGVEDQAIDRVHRLGQTREVVVKRYVVDETVEEMILQLQARKEKLARNVLVAAKSADDRASERLSMQDLLAFFK